MTWRATRFVSNRN